ncbi:MAG: transcriptional repressor LexA [Ruminiclostridium sp.]|jgi:repressor LexA|nr:transcriptional repressor LexA [Ruminiclostridium sp.]MBQ5583846.1 transcriptional repressor LexA [Ruminiclostridium sp.]MBR5792011.1 transcriptional repressor LexA [Ruminiclostridium sp.]
MANLTPKQQKIYDFIRDFSREYGYPPTVREIGEHLGLKSPSTVKFHLDNLRAAGLIQWDGGKTRSITLLEKEDEPKEDMVPVLGNVAAGSPILAQECIEEYVSFQTGPHPEDYFALKVRGESMLYAGILPDDLVVVRRQPEAHSGEIVVALFEDEATVKTLSKKNGQVWLLPENPDYEPIDGTRAQIIGKVVGLIRRY